MEKNSKRISSIDGLRAFAAISIVIFHVFVILPYEFNNGFANEIIYKLGTLVSLFMVISAFSMCCGYFEKIKNNQISLNDFYKKRYLKTLPFFFMMVCIDLVVSKFSSNSMIEGFANVTLLFAFIPGKHIEVIGIAWTLGVIFAFYVLFPFFVFMIWNKKRAWFSLVVSCLLSYFMANYFMDHVSQPVVNIIYWLPFFVVGGIIFLYKDKLIEIFKNKKAIIIFSIALVTSVIRVINPLVFGKDLYDLYRLISDAAILIFGVVSSNIALNNKITHFLSAISLEVYLCHTMIIRIVEKLGLFTFTESNAFNTIVSCIVVIIMTIAFAYCASKTINLLFQKYNKYQKQKNNNIQE